MVTDADGATKNAVQKVFSLVPTILCTWHVNERISAKYIKEVGNEGHKEFMAAWKWVLTAPTIDDFNQEWKEFSTTYQKGQTEELVYYIQNQWIYHGKKERLCAAWTNQYRHYGILVSSR